MPMNQITLDGLPGDTALTNPGGGYDTEYLEGLWAIGGDDPYSGIFGFFPKKNPAKVGSIECEYRWPPVCPSDHPLAGKRGTRSAELINRVCALIQAPFRLFDHDVEGCDLNVAQSNATFSFFEYRDERILAKISRHQVHGIFAFTVTDLVLAKANRRKGR